MEKDSGARLIFRREGTLDYVQNVSALCVIHWKEDRNNCFSNIQYKSIQKDSFWVTFPENQYVMRGD